MANFALAGGILTLVFQSKDKKLQLMGSLGFLSATPLLVVKDMHGGAIIIGAFLTFLFTWQNFKTGLL